MKFEIMDVTGHSVVDFSNDAMAAEEKFKELTGVGFTAAVPTGDGEHKVVRNFKDVQDDVLFIPRLQGG